MADVTHNDYNRMLGLGITVFYILLFLSSVVSGKTINVSTVGEFTSALSGVVAGDTVLLQGGTYTMPYNASAKNSISIASAGQKEKVISVIVENNKRAIFDFSYIDNSRYLNASIQSHGFYFETTAKYWYFRGISITRAGYQGAYVTGSNITFENCVFFKNWNTGLEINKGGSNITVINCDAYGNYDGNYKNGSMADGFGPKETQGPGNQFIGCRSWDNSDDGFDTYGSNQTVSFEKCWAFRNGFDLGNGNGFKVGGHKDTDQPIPEIVKLSNCVAFANSGNTGRGFDQNNNFAGITVYNCVSYKNETSNYYFTSPIQSSDKHIFKNNISLGTTNNITTTNATESNNSWSTGFSVTSADFESLDTTLATIGRNPDGTLPETKLFRLKTTSTLINNGVDVGLPFNGNNPDLGAFETDVGTNAINKNAEFSDITFIQAFSQNRLCIMLSAVANNARVSVFALNGVMLLYTTINNSREITIDCSFLKSGFYLTEVETDGVIKRLTFSK